MKRKPPGKDDLPFDDGDAAGAGARVMAKKERGASLTFNPEMRDLELRATYGSNEPAKPAFVYVERGPGAGQLVQLKRGPLIIGRASISDLRLQHPSISRRHAQIKRIGEQVFLKDLGSQNGTFVNKIRIHTEIELFPGDQIALGNAALKVRGPLVKGEALRPPRKESPISPKKAAAKTSIGFPAAREQPVPLDSGGRIVKVAVFAGAIGFGLAGILAFALVKGVGIPTPATVATPAAPSAAKPELPIAVDEVKVKQNKAVDAAILEKMRQASPAPSLDVQKEAKADSPKPVGVAKSPSKKAAVRKQTGGPTSRSQAIDDAFGD